MKNKSLCGIAYCAALLMCACIGHAQTREEVFTRDAYPDSAFTISTDSLRLGDVRVHVLQVRHIANTKATHDFYDFNCRGWVTVSRPGDAGTPLYFSCEPVGGSFGIYIPRNQPSPEYCALVIMQDYDGVLLLVDTLGRVSRFMGGYYWLTKDRRYLFSTYASDLRALEVIDLHKGTSVFAEEFSEQTDPFQWFEHDGEYYYTCEKNPDSIFVFSFQRNRFSARLMNASWHAISRRIPQEFEPPDGFNCGCEDKRRFR